VRTAFVAQLPQREEAWLPWQPCNVGRTSPVETFGDESAIDNFKSPLKLLGDFSRKTICGTIYHTLGIVVHYLQQMSRKIFILQVRFSQQVFLKTFFLRSIKHGLDARDIAVVEETKWML
jgi:hypothetical protein